MGSLALQAAVYLLAAVIAVPVAKRLGLGSVLGYLIAGVLVGPFVLNLVGDPAEVQAFAGFGVVILLFLVGLEIRPEALWSMRRLIFGLGGLQMVGTTAVLALGGLALGLPWREALALSTVLALTSTAVALQTLEDRALRRTPVGSATYGVLLLQAVAVIPLFALLPLLAPAGVETTAPGPTVPALRDAPGWIQGLAVLAAVTAVVLVGRFGVNRVFRLIAASRLREIFTAFALLIVIGVTLLMEAVGLSAALGAFLAGVVLAESEFRREIEADIEPFRGLLLGLFFITVGAGLDLALIGSAVGPLIGLVLALTLAKVGVMYAAGRLFRLRKETALVTAAALAPGDEFAFVLLALLVGAGVVAAQTGALLVAATALTMAVAPLVIRAAERFAAPAAGVGRDEPENDFDLREPDAVVAGSGRFGQIVVRVLTANGFHTSVLENSIEQIELLRRFDRRVHYGDAGRLDLLRAAGAETAKIFVCAVDEKERALEIVETVREAFPHLVVLARAFDRRHAYELMNRGAHVIERETFEGGLAMAGEALRALGWRAYRAERATRLFRRHDERLFHELRPLWGDEERFRIATRESSPRMEDLLRADLRRLAPDASDDGWNSASLRDEPRETEARKTAAE
jgi:glutathione-regulated potassium-efflux system ancillary protein KefC/glutathione-regulated potassium-efflux system protein KefB